MQYTMQSDSGALRIVMEGDFSFHDSRSFYHMLNSIKGTIETVEIRLNMARLESIDAMALGMLLIAFDAMKKNHKHLIFEQPHGQVHEALNRAAQYNAISIAS